MLILMSLVTPVSVRAIGDQGAVIVNFVVAGADGDNLDRAVGIALDDQASVIHDCRNGQSQPLFQRFKP